MGPSGNPFARSAAPVDDRLRLFIAFGPDGDEQPHAVLKLSAHLVRQAQQEADYIQERRIGVDAPACNAEGNLALVIGCQ